MMVMVLGHVVVAGLALRIAWVDCRRFQIEYESLLVLAGIVLALTWAGGGLAAAGRTAGMAALELAALAVMVRVALIRPPGAGDWALLGVCLAMAVDALVVFVVVLAISGLGAAGFYSWIRRKPLFRSRFPLAPPALLAAVTAFWARHPLSGGFW